MLVTKHFSILMNTQIAMHAHTLQWLNLQLQIAMVTLRCCQLNARDLAFSSANQQHYFSTTEESFNEATCSKQLDAACNIDMKSYYNVSKQ